MFYCFSFSHIFWHLSYNLYLCTITLPSFCCFVQNVQSTKRRCRQHYNKNTYTKIIVTGHRHGATSFDHFTHRQEYGHSLFFQRFLKQSDQTQSGDVGLAEFIHYVREHEKNLRLQFTHLDKNRDGKVDLEELIDAFKDLGIEMDRHEAAKLLKRFKLLLIIY